MCSFNDFVKFVRYDINGDFAEMMEFKITRDYHMIMINKIKRSRITEKSFQDNLLRLS